MSDGKIVFAKNKIYNADCFDLIAVMPDESLDLVIVDPLMAMVLVMVETGKKY